VRPRLRHRTSLENNQGISIIEGALSGGNTFDPAISDFTKAIHMGPPFSDAYFARGNVYSNHGNLEEAIRDSMVSLRWFRTPRPTALPARQSDPDIDHDSHVLAGRRKIVSTKSPRDVDLFVLSFQAVPHNI
jgi:hypothetical protein